MISPYAPVRDSVDLDRIIALPKRSILTADQERAFARAWTWALLTDEGRRELLQIEALPEPQRTIAFEEAGKRREPLLLAYVQAVFLSEARELGGGYLFGTVGTGKTLCAWLLPSVFPTANPWHVVPAGLRDQTLGDFAKLSRLWRAGPRTPQIVHYETISQPENVGYLCGCRQCTGALEDSPHGIRPTTLSFDECDLLRSKKSGRRNRFFRFLTNHLQHCRSFFMTGTPMRKDFTDYAPMLTVSLRERAPIPLSKTHLTEWVECISSERRPPGALVKLCETEPPPGFEMEAVRKAFLERVSSTPGVIFHAKQSSDKPIVLRFIAAPHEPEVDAAFHKMRATEKTIDGWTIEDPLTNLLYGSELGTNYYSMWDPRPPKHWIEARTKAMEFIREKIKRSRANGRAKFDTPKTVYLAFPDEPALAEWKQIEPTFKPNSVAVPVGSAALGQAAAFARAHGPMLIWVKHIYPGQVISRMLGVPFFGPEGRDEKKRHIDDYPADRSAVVSVDSNKRGRNLQRWHKGFVLGPSSDATDWEQAMLGRMHRQGQTHPVELTIQMSCAEDLRAFENALAEAQRTKDQAKHLQKLEIATYDWSQFPTDRFDLPLDHPGRARWTLPE